MAMLMYGGTIVDIIFWIVWFRVRKWGQIFKYRAHLAPNGMLRFSLLNLIIGIVFEALGDDNSLYCIDVQPATMFVLAGLSG